MRWGVLDLEPPGLRSDGGGGEEEREARAGESAVSTPGESVSKFRWENVDMQMLGRCGMPEMERRVRIDLNMSAGNAVWI